MFSNAVHLCNNKIKFESDCQSIENKHNVVWKCNTLNALGMTSELCVVLNCENLAISFGEDAASPSASVDDIIIEPIQSHNNPKVRNGAALPPSLVCLPLQLLFSLFCFFRLCSVFCPHLFLPLLFYFVFSPPFLNFSVSSLSLLSSRPSSSSHFSLLSPLFSSFPRCFVCVFFLLFYLHLFCPFFFRSALTFRTPPKTPSPPLWAPRFSSLTRRSVGGSSST